MTQAYVYEDDATGWRLMAASDLPNSGVTAATYGDSTHVSQVAVNAQGLVTSASNVAISAGGGTVTSVSSADTSIVVTNPTTTPSLQLAKLNTIATNGPPTADWSNNSHKITSLANGSGAQDAAAFGQIPTALPPNGTAGGDLASTYPNPNVAAIHETGGPTKLTIGSIPDGDVVKRSGTTLIGSSAGSGTISDLTSTGSTITVSSPTGPTTNVDLPTTGVSAGTYGDSTHVSEVTVDAEGRVTSATSVAISGSAGAGGLLVLYDSGYLAADTATLDTGAGGVAAGHFALMVVAYLRSTAAGSDDNVLLTLNNDGSALYNLARTRVTNVTGANAGVVTGTSANIGSGMGDGAAAHSFASLWLDIVAYDGTANYKAGVAHSGATPPDVTSQVHDIQSFTYDSTAAISRLSLAPGTGPKWKAGSRMVVYGLQ